MSWLLDTNVLAELRKGGRGNPHVRQWFEVHRDENHFISVLVLGEIRRGIELKRLKDPVSADHLERWASRVEADFEARVLPINATIATLWGRLNVPDPLPAVDGLIAATALTYDLTLVTRNVRDFKRTGASTLNPFNPSTDVT